MMRQFPSLVVCLWAACFLLADEKRDCFYRDFWKPRCYFKVVPDDQLGAYSRCLSFQRPMGESEKKQRSELVADGIREWCAEECLFALQLLVCSEMRERGYQKASFAEEREGPSLDTVRDEIFVRLTYNIGNWNEVACLLALQLVGQQRGMVVKEVSFVDMSQLTSEIRNEVKLIVRQAAHVSGFLSAVKVRLEMLGIATAVPGERQGSVPLRLSEKERDDVRNLVRTAVYMDDFRAKLKDQIEFFGVDGDEVLKAVVHTYWFGDAWEEEHHFNSLGR